MTIDRALIKRIENSVIEHPNFVEVKDFMLAHIQYGPSDLIQYALGSTGVGKSTTIRMCHHILTKYVAEHPDLGFGPPIILQAFAPEKGDFDWKAFYALALDIMGEPKLKSKIDIERAIRELQAGHFAPAYIRMKPASMRGLYLQNIEARRPISIFIDEVQHLAKCKDPEDVTNNLDILKGLANTKQTTYAAFGTLAAQDMLYRNAQLSRRLDTLHFKRYTDTGTDYSTFTSIIENIFDKFSITISPDVKKDYLYFFRHTLGCVGMFVDWLIKALRIAIYKGKSTLDKRVFESTRLKNIQLRPIAMEIARFERMHREDGPFDPSLYFEKNESDGALAISSISPAKKGNKSPGARKPSRDKVGLL